MRSASAVSGEDTTSTAMDQHDPFESLFHLEDRSYEEGFRQGVELASLQPSEDLLDRLKATTIRVCPLVCGKGMEEKAGRCVKKQQEARVEPKLYLCALSRVLEPLSLRTTGLKHTGFGDFEVQTRYTKPMWKENYGEWSRTWTYVCQRHCGKSSSGRQMLST